MKKRSDINKLFRLRNQLHKQLERRNYKNLKRWRAVCSELNKRQRKFNLRIYLASHYYGGTTYKGKACVFNGHTLKINKNSYMTFYCNGASLTVKKPKSPQELQDVFCSEAVTTFLEKHEVVAPESVFPF